MNVLITGASGLIGSALRPVLEQAGHSTVLLRRDGGGAAGAAGPCWNPDTGSIQLAAAGRLDAVIHLAGETVAQRWTAPARQRIRSSRIEATRLLCAGLQQLPHPPGVLICASATGFYGDRGDEWLDESSPAGTGFLAEVTRAWEAASAPAEKAGWRVVRLRFGIVLSPRGGALARMLLPFRLGIAGRLGHGRQYWSWIALEDVLGVIQRMLADAALAGVFNTVAPAPVTNREFTATLARVLQRPAFFTMPRPAVQLCFGEMGREALLSSARVRPARLQQAGFEFRMPDLETALRRML